MSDQDVDPSPIPVRGLNLMNDSEPQGEDPIGTETETFKRF